MKSLYLLIVFLALILLITLIYIFKENKDENKDEKEKLQKYTYTLSNISDIDTDKNVNENPYIINNYKEKMNNFIQLISQISNTNNIPKICYNISNIHNIPDSIDLSNEKDNLKLNAEIFSLSEFALEKNLNKDGINYQNIALLYLFLMKNFTGLSIKYIQIVNGNPDYVSFDTDFNTGIIPFKPSDFVKEFIKNKTSILENRPSDYNSRPTQSKAIIDYILNHKEDILKDIEYCELNNDIVFHVDILNKLLGIQYLINFISTPYVNLKNDCDM